MSTKIFLPNLLENRKSIFRKLITRKEKLTLEGILAFEKQANKLIELLAVEYGLNLSEAHPFGKLITRSNDLWKGFIAEEWSYQFHGDACLFESNKTGQTVDVKINRIGNYGAIHIFGFLHFLETTERLSYIFKELNTTEVVSEIVDELQRKQFIVDVDNPPFSTRVLNKDRIDYLLTTI